ncbi:hypothetical protein MTP03_00500 [Tsukamurella sp. PLM1]|nr:hypothetical protein MTP03_00500 [Tsukamurella sp. PLM1]
MIGGTVAGLLGMVLGAPVLAAVLKSVAAVRCSRTVGRPDGTVGPAGTEGTVAAGDGA